MAPLNMSKIIEDATLAAQNSGVSLESSNILAFPTNKFGELEGLKTGDIWDFKEFAEKMSQLSSRYDIFRERVKTNRELRYQDIDDKKLAKDGKQSIDHVTIIRRIIHNNIGMNNAPRSEYIKTARRAVVLNCISDPDTDTTELENNVTQVLRYENWEKPFDRLLDGAELHGWAGILTEFDISKPGHVGFTYLPHDGLIFPEGAKQLQEQKYLMLPVPVTKSRLKSWVKQFDFNEEAVNQVITSGKDNSGTVRVELESTVTVFRLYYRGEDGYIYNAWYARSGADRWLKAPEKVFLGIYEKKDNFNTILPNVGPELGADQSVNWSPVYEQEYPIDIYLPYETENEVIDSHKGQAFFSRSLQVAATSLWTSYVNAAQRASRVFGSPEKPIGSSNQIEPLSSVKIKPDSVYNQKIDFWTMPAPSQGLIMAANAISTENAQDQNQVEHTVLNRDDARKTAEEMKIARSQQETFDSISVKNLSPFMGSVNKRGFRIVMSRARQGKLPEFLKLTGNESVRQATGSQGEVDPAKSTREYLLDQKYGVKPAGDIDIVKRGEKVRKIENFLPNIQGTNLWKVMMIDLVRAIFPEEGGRYARVIEEEIQQQQSVQQLVGVVSELLQAFGQSLPPDKLQNIQAIIQNATQQPTTG